MTSTLTIAQTIARKVKGAQAYTLAGGYAIFDHGRRALFPAGRLISEKRNEAGRATSAVYSYADSSTLIFRWHPQHGASLRA